MDNEIIEKAKEQAKEEVKSPKKSVSKKRAPSRTSRTFTQILNGDFLNREFVLNNLNYIFFILFLLLVLVAKGYYGKELMKDVDTEQKKLNEITADYIAAKAKLEEETRRIKLVEQLEPKGLKETVNPTKVIRIRKEN